MRREHTGACDVYNVIQSLHQFRYTPEWCSERTSRIWAGMYPTMEGAIMALDPFHVPRLHLDLFDVAGWLDSVYSVGVAS